MPQPQKIIGTIRIPATVGQAVRINGKKYTEETVWTLDDIFGGETNILDFIVDNRSNKDFPFDADFSLPTSGGFTVTITDLLDVPIILPYTILGHETLNWKLKLELDKETDEGSYEIVIIFDFV